MSWIRPCVAKNHDALTREWSQLAKERHRQISSGEDISFDHVIVPTVLDLLKHANTEVVLDIGCGTGEFTSRLAQTAGKVVGVEPSVGSISMAQQNCQSATNVQFVDSALEEIELDSFCKDATAAVAVMTLMTTPDIRKFALTLQSLLPDRSCFVALITHPWFWPRYRGYDSEPWFQYDTETFIETPFVISRCTTEFVTTHIHRSLEQYLTVFSQVGFRIESLAEPTPSAEIQALYSVPWQFPRFLGLRWVTAK